MVFKRKFFLDLSGGEVETGAVVVAPVRQEPVAKPAEKPAAPVAATTPAAAPASSTPATAGGSPEPAGGPSLTTAEAIAAELAAAQANRPAPSLATCAPACVTAGGALPQRRRRAGANLAGFKAMAEGMMKS
ncbi:MAG: hypothetical protein ACK55D_06560 [Synechococcaceae cyanobacterium]